MAIYSMEQIVGKTLFAAKDIPVRYIPYDNAPVAYTVKRGQAVGVVDSWLNPRTGRSVLYFQFIDSTGKNYYTPSGAGLYSLTRLEDQGALTVEQELEANKPPQTLSEILQKNFKLLLIVAAIAVVAKAALPELIKRGKG